MFLFALFLIKVKWLKCNTIPNFFRWHALTQQLTLGLWWALSLRDTENQAWLCWTITFTYWEAALTIKATGWNMSTCTTPKQTVGRTGQSLRTVSRAWRPAWCWCLLPWWARPEAGNSAPSRHGKTWTWTTRRTPARTNVCLSRGDVTLLNLV